MNIRTEDEAGEGRQEDYGRQEQSRTEEWYAKCLLVSACVCSELHSPIASDFCGLSLNIM